MTEDTPTRLAAIQARVEAATGGPCGGRHGDAMNPRAWMVLLRVILGAILVGMGVTRGGATGGVMAGCGLVIACLAAAERKSG